MDGQRLQQLIRTFFTRDKATVLEILREFLTTLEVEERIPPGLLMSRNYETAQDNPEIHTIPGNLKDARDAIFPYFWGTDGWASHLHLENVKGPANYASLIGAIACLLKNPNLCVDTYSQRSNELEVKAVTALANLLFYHTESPWGVFTMGGTISNLYGGKIGIEKVCPEAMRKGYGGTSLAGVVSEAAHYSNATLAGWLGIGTENLVAVPTDRELSMRLDQLESTLERLHAEGRAVAFVIATFGSTDAFGIDDVAGIRSVVDDFAARRGVPTPQLHVDAAVGWALCFLAEYDLDRDPLELGARMLARVARAQAACRTLRHADSVTLDFHKLGWGHYPASAFIVNRKGDLRHLFRTKDAMPYFSEADYRHDPALFTLECSRPAIGPYSVMASLNGIGLIGMQTLVAHAIAMATRLKERIEELEHCKVLNLEAIGPSVTWWVLPKGRDAKAIFRAIEEGTLSEEHAHRTFGEVRRLFEKRQATLDPAVDARLSFTTSVGYRPHGHDLPAWKAVFFNPRTDEAVVDQIVRSIEDVA
jgi:glutamate/tyrosine decarboxylase-like PLP-dependent enzyme